MRRKDEVFRHCTFAPACQNASMEEQASKSRDGSGANGREDVSKNGRTNELLPSKVDDEPGSSHQSRTLSRTVTRFAKPDYSYYSTYETFISKLKESVASAEPTESAQWETRSAKDGDYEAQTDIITIRPSAFREGGDEMRVLLNFGEHGREIITSEVGAKLVRSLLARQSLPARFKNQTTIEKVEDMLGNTIIKIVPVENKNGRILVEAGNFCERKNGRGVDLNRNWGLDWGTKAPDYDPEEEYPGKAPFSEPEVRITKDLVEEFRPHIWINFHSGMEGLFIPYNYKEKVPTTPLIDSVLGVLKIINDQYCSSKCAIGPGGNTVGYLAHGTADDYIFDRIGIPVVMTWEIYGANAHRDDCFRMFNPISMSSYTDVLLRWELAIVDFLSEAYDRKILRSLKNTPLNLVYEKKSSNQSEILDAIDPDSILVTALFDYTGIVEGFVFALILIGLRSRIRKRPLRQRI
uniref:Peptidase M14 domain-containing protein n=1 Tax=Picocystis salinarum TaxID=88271 RepID=A0A7S3UAI7_9CHLO